MDQLRRTIVRLRRRAGWVRVAERAGMGIVAGSVGTIFLLPLHFGIALLASCFVAAVVGGLAWGWMTRPSAMAVAVEIDRQMRLGELLSTAWGITHVRRPSAVDMEEMVVAVANEACARMDGRMVALASFGGRGWAAIGLLAGLSVSLNLLAVDMRSSVGAGGQAGIGASEGTWASVGSIERGRPTGSAPADADRSFGNIPPSVAASGAGQGGNTGRTGPDGSSGGIGRTDVRMNRTDMNAGGGLPQLGGGQVAGGTGEPAMGSAGDAQGTIGAAEQPMKDAAPWDSSTWPAAVQGASDKLLSGRIDARYEDLVRDYFNRNENK